MSENQEQVVNSVKAIIQKTLTDNTLTKSAKMRNLLEMGLTRSQVSELMGVSYQFVYQVDKRRLQAAEESAAAEEFDDAVNE